MHYEVKSGNEIVMTQDLGEAVARSEEFAAKAGREVTVYMIEIAHIARPEREVTA